METVPSLVEPISKRRSLSRALCGCWTDLPPGEAVGRNAKKLKSPGLSTRSMTRTVSPSISISMSSMRPSSRLHGEKTTSARRMVHTVAASPFQPRARKSRSLAMMRFQPSQRTLLMRRLPPNRSESCDSIASRRMVDSRSTIHAEAMMAITPSSVKSATVRLRNRRRMLEGASCGAWRAIASSARRANSPGARRAMASMRSRCMSGMCGSSLGRSSSG